ncbi:MAG: DUF4253 domain-containing protein [Acidimicrobiales bacterium]
MKPASSIGGTMTASWQPDGPQDKGGPPAFALAVLAGFGLGQGFRSTPIAQGRAEAWATTVPGELAVDIWEALASAGAQRWWPIIVGSENQERIVAEQAEFSEGPPAVLLDRTAALDAVALIDRWKTEAEIPPDQTPPGYDVVGEWPEHAEPATQFTLPYKLGTDQPVPTVLALVAAASSAEVPAILGWGNWNACPKPEEHVAMMRRWEAAYGARLVGLSSAVIEMQVTRPPTTREGAMDLAEEQFAYCSDIVHQGVGTISALASMLLDGTAWYFWWD